MFRFVSRRLSLAVALCLTLLCLSCSDSEVTVVDDTPDSDYNFAPLLTNYVDDVVVPTYRTLRDRAALLRDAVAAYNAQPDNQNLLNSAAQRWKETRVPWENSEAFLFGPAGFLALDPAIDSWPVDRNQLEGVLDSAQDLTPDFVTTGLGDALKGFHTIEYLLFREGQPRAVTSITSRERAYLVASTTVLATHTAQLWDAWDGDFAVDFKNAGGTGSSYANQTDAVFEWVQGMIDICDEVANGKIADPYDESNAELVESQFSWNSLDDFQNNIRSVRAAYTGDFALAGTESAGLDTFISAFDTTLSARVTAEIDAAIVAIAAIPYPFRDNLHRTGEIEAAQAAVTKVLNTLENDVKPKISQTP